MARLEDFLELGELNRSYKKYHLDLVHHKEIILTYCKRNNWDNLVQDYNK